jgi:hypothetical protein
MPTPAELVQLLEQLLELKHRLWNELPDVGSDPVAAARFQLICEVCEIFGVNALCPPACPIKPKKGIMGSTT